MMGPRWTTRSLKPHTQSRKPRLRSHSEKHMQRLSLSQTTLAQAPERSFHRLMNHGTKPSRIKI